VLPQSRGDARQILHGLKAVQDDAKVGLDFEFRGARRL